MEGIQSRLLQEVSALSKVQEQLLKVKMESLEIEREKERKHSSEREKIGVGYYPKIHILNLNNF